MRLTAAVKMRMVKPVDGDWDAAGSRLRELASIAHRVLNRTVAMLAVRDDAPGFEAPREWRSSGGKVQAYNCAAVAIEAVNRDRLTIRPCKRCDGTGVEPETVGTAKRNRAVVSRAPGEKCAKCDGAKVITGGAAVDSIPSAIHGGWARVADRKYATDRGDLLKGSKSLPSWRRGAPIAIRSSDEIWTLRHDGRNYVLSFPAFGGRNGRLEFVVNPDRGGAHEHARRLILASSKRGDLKIVPPRDGKRGWVAVMSYSWDQEPTLAAGSSSPIVLRWTKLGAVVMVGAKARVIHGAEDVRRQRAKFSARKSSRSKHQRDIAPGARGHGRARVLEHYHAPDDAESRWVGSICQEVAAKAVKRAQAVGARWVDIDEDSFPDGTIPPARLRECLKWALKRAGLEPKDLPAAKATGKGTS